MAWTIEISLVEPWLTELSEVDPRSAELVFAALDVLALEGPALGRPLVDTVNNSRHRNMKELRPGSARRTEVRILFAFDPQRHAVLLVAGDKSRNWRSWYSKAIARADDLFDQHLHSLSGQ